MKTDFGKVALIIGSANLTFSLEVVILTSVIEGDGMWFIPYSISMLFSMLSYLLMFLAAIFGMVGIRRESSPRFIMAVFGIILGFLGAFIVGASNIKLVVFQS